MIVYAVMKGTRVLELYSTRELAQEDADKRTALFQSSGATRFEVQSVAVLDRLRVQRYQP